MSLLVHESFQNLETLAGSDGAGIAAVRALELKYQDVLLDHRQGQPMLPEVLSRQLDYLHETERLALVMRAHLLDDTGVRDAIMSEPLWSSWQGLEGVPTASTDMIGDTLLGTLDVKADEKVLVQTAPTGRHITEEILRRVLSVGAHVTMMFQDDNVKKALIERASDEGIGAVGKHRADQYAWADKFVGPSATEGVSINSARLKLFQQAEAPGRQRIMDGRLRRTTTIVPSPIDAERDGMGYSEYLQLFVESCDQPWEQMFDAQERLLEVFDNASEVYITNSDGTAVRFNIKGQTFANSVTWANVPGAEMFSSPVRDGVDGTIAAMGNFMYEGHLIKDINLLFRRGRVIKASAAVGDEYLDMILDRDKDAPGEPSRHLGELGIGTNPHLGHLLARKRKSTVNRLLVEKVGSSFHVAIGGCYGITSYAGKSVNLQNGNKSPSGLHWDMTTMLGGRNGHMFVDEKLIQADGMWLGEHVGIQQKDIAVLNEGWGALSVDRRPEWFRQQYPDGYR